MKFNNIKDFVLHSFESPIPIDIKLENDYASVKIGRSGYIHLKRYIPEKNFDINVFDIEEENMEKHMATIIGKDMSIGDSMVAAVNKKICIIRKINGYTTIIFYINPRFEFISEDEMNKSVKDMVQIINKKQ